MTGGPLLSEGLDQPLGCHHSLSLVQSNSVGTYAMDLSSSCGKVALIMQLYCPFIIFSTKLLLPY